MALLLTTYYYLDKRWFFPYSYMENFHAVHVLSIKLSYALVFTYNAILIYIKSFSVISFLSSYFYKSVGRYFAKS